MHALDPVWATIKDQFTAARFESAQAARAEVTNELNQCFRRLRQYQTEGEWISAILDTAASFVDPVALFTYEAGTLRLRGERNSGGLVGECDQRARDGRAVGVLHSSGDA